MKKHTSGPWRVEFFENGGYDAMTGAYCIVGEGTIAELDLYEYGQGPCKPAGDATVRQARANAYLIAAAPDMLDVLRAVAKHFAATDAPLGNAARAIIAKIENDE